MADTAVRKCLNSQRAPDVPAFADQSFPNVTWTSRVCAIAELRIQSCPGRAREAGLQKRPLTLATRPTHRHLIQGATQSVPSGGRPPGLHARNEPSERRSQVRLLKPPDLAGVFIRTCKGHPNWRQSALHSKVASNKFRDSATRRIRDKQPGRRLVHFTYRATQSITAGFRGKFGPYVLQQSFRQASSDL
ncbi:hypothetical protein CCUS01_04663 [Colletotrichum cuscutae]|uniref:Uncharacterized protein n=1 Tax=Colletotrichum cuscutae TaxID=1209917 RepID=A0AAI9V9Y0_9PEZI|nr:hypothetical protein CCUS01_04663 [Colletotrichum cuscutae]